MTKSKVNFDGQTVFVGMDIHKKSWNPGIYLNDLFIRNVHQSPNPEVMVRCLQQTFPGARYKATYEAGKFGFWIQRQLSRLGVECLVVNPADIPRSQKDTLNKSDPRDARNLDCVYRAVCYTAFISLMNNRKPIVCCSDKGKNCGVF